MRTSLMVLACCLSIHGAALAEDGSTGAAPPDLRVTYDATGADDPGLRDFLAADEAAVAAAVLRARLCLAEFERLMGDDPYLVGDRPTLADVLVLPILSYLEATPEGEEMLAPPERLRSWAGRMTARESARQVLAAA